MTVVLDLGSRLADAVGGRTAKPLERAFGIATVGDLLRHYPRRMAERGELTDLGSLHLDEEVTVIAEVRRCTKHEHRSAPRVEVLVGDDRGTLALVFFGRRSMWRANELTPGTRALFSGKVGQFRGKRQLVHPQYQVLSGDNRLDRHEADDYAGKLIPVYPASKDIRSWHIGNAVQKVLFELDPLTDPLPEPIRERHGLLELDTALRAMHRPEDMDQWWRARRRLTWDEAFAVQLILARRRAVAARHPALGRPARQGGLLDAFDARLPFSLTAGQREVGVQIGAELAGTHPMHRLLQGEVGSGKTVVALRAMLQVVDAGAQAALLAPTEVLAVQHARTVESLLGPLAHAGQLDGAEHATRVALLTGSLPAAARKAALLDAASGAAGIVIGTHALIQDQVGFAELGLVVVDEQHRFGVEQRDALRGKAERPPHLLVMTATPIPRTVAMTVFGDLETSTLRELPTGRAGISSTVVPSAERPAWLERAWTRIREEVAAGHQAYVVCPRIGAELDEGELELDAALGPMPEPDDVPARRPPLAVLDVAAMLADGPLAGLRVASLHGRQGADEKDLAMAGFAAGHIDVLVATTVVEVGVDVANASVMVVLDAERFGVSQLHQLRGRIGRGTVPGVCLLVTEAPSGSPSRERLEAVAATTDGFELARLDLAQRREGDVLGAAQSGRRSQLRLLSLLRDEKLISAARTEATELVRADPELAGHPLLAAEVAVLAADDRAEFLDKA